MLRLLKILTLRLYRESSFVVSGVAGFLDRPLLPTRMQKSCACDLVRYSRGCDLLLPASSIADRG